MSIDILSCNITRLNFVEPSHPALSEVAEEVTRDEIASQVFQELIKKMFEIAGVERGNPHKTILVGLAAPQLGILKRVILVDTGANGKGGITHVKVYINPTIIQKSEDEVEWYEGCFSTGKVAGIVSRPRVITVSALNEHGEDIVETHEGYVARIFQHEIDHLDGRRFPSRIKDESKLHFVEKNEFPAYRNQEKWRTWDKRCSQEEWEAIKQGKAARLEG